MGGPRDNDQRLGFSFLIASYEAVYTNIFWKRNPFPLCLLPPSKDNEVVMIVIYSTVDL